MVCDWQDKEETRQDQVPEMVVKVFEQHDKDQNQIQRRFPSMIVDRGMHASRLKDKVNASHSEVDFAINSLVRANILQVEHPTKKWRMFALTNEQGHRIPGHPQAEARRPGPEHEHRQPGTTRKRRKSS